MSQCKQICVRLSHRHAGSGVEDDAEPRRVTYLRHQDAQSRIARYATRERPPTSSSRFASVKQPPHPHPARHPTPDHEPRQTQHPSPGHEEDQQGPFAAKLARDEIAVRVQAPVGLDLPSGRPPIRRRGPETFRFGKSRIHFSEMRIAMATRRRALNTSHCQTSIYACCATRATNASAASLWWNSSSVSSSSSVTGVRAVSMYSRRFGSRFAFT